MSRQQQHVVRFSCIVENIPHLKRFGTILECVEHPCIMADVLVTMVVPKEKIFDLPYKSYSDDKDTAEHKHGGLRIFKVYDTESFIGEDKSKSIMDEYRVGCN